jgi:hypothetical protein
MRRCCIWKQPHRAGCRWKRNGKPRRPFLYSTSFTTTRRQRREKVQTPVVSRWRLSPRRDCHRTGIRRALLGNCCIAGAAFASRLRSISSAPTPAQRPQPANSEGSVLDHIALRTIGGTCKRAGVGVARVSFESFSASGAVPHVLKVQQTRLWTG